jgi:hypothetical protein
MVQRVETNLRLLYNHLINFISRWYSQDCYTLAGRAIARNEICTPEQ